MTRQRQYLRRALADHQRAEHFRLHHGAARQVTRDDDLSGAEPGEVLEVVDTLVDYGSPEPARQMVLARVLVLPDKRLQVIR